MGKGEIPMGERGGRENSTVQIYYYILCLKNENIHTRSKSVKKAVKSLPRYKSYGIIRTANCFASLILRRHVRESIKQFQYSRRAQEKKINEK